MIKLRQWQEECKEKALNWFNKEKHFLINAAPGSGKTIAAIAITKELIEKDLIDRVIIIAPRTKVVEQWAEEHNTITGREIYPVTAKDGDLEYCATDLCATWNSIQNMQDAIQAICKSSRTLVILDEQHHAAVLAVWGRSANNAFNEAEFTIILSGTPIRTDGSETSFLAYDDYGAIAHPEEGTYTLSYGDAVRLNYCRPVTCHRHFGRFHVRLDNVDIPVSSDEEADIPTELIRHPGLQNTLDFYRLAKKRLYEADNTTPIEGNYQQTMIEHASEKLTEIRYRLPNAGGLVIAPDIEMAKYFVKVIEKVEGKKPVMVHSHVSNPARRIANFRNNEERWLVSVAMVSEGVDIPRLRTLVYLPYSQTELSFRQAIGRVVRTCGPNDDSYAYVVMPSLDQFNLYASRIEDELPPNRRGEQPLPRTKRCPACDTECALHEKICPECHYQFNPSGDPGDPRRWKTCSECGALNTITAENCQNCGASFTPEIEISLDEAIRDGVITSGMLISEEDAKEGERIAPQIRAAALRTGNLVVIRATRNFTDESFKVIRDVFVNDIEIIDRENK